VQIEESKRREKEQPRLQEEVEQLKAALGRVQDQLHDEQEASLHVKHTLETQLSTTQQLLANTEQRADELGRHLDDERRAWQDQMDDCVQQLNEARRKAGESGTLTRELEGLRGNLQKVQGQLQAEQQASLQLKHDLETQLNDLRGLLTSSDQRAEEALQSLDEERRKCAHHEDVIDQMAHQLADTDRRLQDTRRLLEEQYTLRNEGSSVVQRLQRQLSEERAKSIGSHREVQHLESERSRLKQESEAAVREAAIIRSELTDANSRIGQKEWRGFSQADGSRSSGYHSHHEYSSASTTPVVPARAVVSRSGGSLHSSIAAQYGSRYA